MKQRMVIGLVWAALAGLAGCDGRHGCLPLPPVDAGPSDGAIEKIAIMLPEAGADGAPGDRSDGTAGDRGDGATTIDGSDARPPDGGNDGSVTIGITFNTCPNIVASTASPPAAPVGATITVAVAANDPDNDLLTYSWTANTGTFAMPANAGTTYTCAVSGPQPLTAKVSDGQCTVMSVLVVTCLPPDAGAVD